MAPRAGARSRPLRPHPIPALWGSCPAFYVVTQGKGGVTACHVLSAADPLRDDLGRRLVADMGGVDELGSSPKVCFWPLLFPRGRSCPEHHLPGAWHVASGGLRQCRRSRLPLQATGRSVRRSRVGASPTPYCRRIGSLRQRAPAKGILSAPAGEAAGQREDLP